MAKIQCEFFTLTTFLEAFGVFESQAANSVGELASFGAPSESGFRSSEFERSSPKLAKLNCLKFRLRILASKTLKLEISIFQDFFPINL